MSDAAALWAELHDLFDEDDGSLPEVRLLGTPPGAVQRIVDDLLARAEPLGGDETAWHNGLNADIPLTAYSDLGSLVEVGTVPFFIVFLEGVEWHGLRLPDLGLFAEQCDVGLNYRMGDEWSAPVLAAFAGLLKHLRTLAPGASLTLAEGVARPVVEQFRRAVDAYEAPAAG
jgi:hypothetical protein